MQCWTVDERARPGIVPEFIVKEGEENEKPTLAIRVGDDFLSFAKPMQKAVERALKEGVYKTVRDAVIHRIRFSNDHKFLVPEPTKTPSDTALVLLIPTPNIDGKIYFNAETYTAKLRDGRVRRRYDPLSKAVGVKVEIESGDDDEQEKLVLMRPNASFRIIKTGKGDDATPSLIVRWNGHTVTVKEIRIGERSRRRTGSLPTRV